MEAARNIFVQIEEMVQNDRQTVIQLKIIKEQIEEHHFECNIAKTCGTSMNAMGVGMTIGGIVLAPFSGGLSLGLSASGITCSVLGGATNFGTELTKGILLNNLRERTRRLMDARRFYQENTFLNVTRLIADIEQDMGDGINVSKLSFEEILNYLDKNRKEFYGAYFSINLLRFINMLTTTGHLLKSSSVGARSGLAIASAATELVISDCEIICTSLNPVGTKFVSWVGGQKIAGAIFKGATIGVGVAFVAADFVLLEKDWNTEEELAVKIQEIIDVINRDIDSLHVQPL